jgi:hypothetical protein
MNHDHNNTKHLLFMLACCLIPIALILAISVFGFSLGSLGAFLPYLLVLACPIGMFFMMRGMGHDESAHDAHQHHVEPKPTEMARGTKVDATPNRE